MWEYLKASRLIISIIKYYTYFYYYQTYNEQYVPAIINNIQSAGCLYIKFAQWISTKLETVEYGASRDPLVDQLSQYYENCRPHNFAHTKETLEKYFETTNLEYVFAHIDKKPIASGSIGQVHRAQLIDGTNVAVKVRHPSIIQQYERSKNVVKTILWLNSYLVTFPFELDSFFDDFEKQMDLTVEAKNTIRFRKEYDGVDFLTFPEIYHYNAELIISRFQTGETYNDATRGATDLQIRRINMLIYTFMANSLLINGFTHGDMHTGNWKIQCARTTNPKIIIYDCGLCHVSQHDNRDIWLSIERRDMRQFMDLALSRVHSCPESALPKRCMDKIKNDFLEQFASEKDNYYNPVSFFPSFFKFLARNKITLQGCVFQELLTCIFMEKVFIGKSFIEVTNRTADTWNEVLREIRMSCVSQCNKYPHKLAQLKQFLISTMPPCPNFATYTTGAITFSDFAIECSESDEDSDRGH